MSKQDKVEITLSSKDVSNINRCVNERTPVQIDKEGLFIWRCDDIEIVIANNRDYVNTESKDFGISEIGKVKDNNGSFWYIFIKDYYMTNSDEEFYKNKKFKLAIELSPYSTRGKSLYNRLKDSGKSSKWKKLKEKIFETEGKKCWICGAENVRLEAHEFWDYDVDKHIQRLTGIHHLCSKCHRVKHCIIWLKNPISTTVVQDKGGNIEEAITHFCKVNKCLREDFEKYFNYVLRIYDKTRLTKWKIDYGKYKSYLRSGKK